MSTYRSISTTHTYLSQWALRPWVVNMLVDVDRVDICVQIWYLRWHVYVYVIEKGNIWYLRWQPVCVYVYGGKFVSTIKAALACSESVFGLLITAELCLKVLNAVVLFCVIYRSIEDNIPIPPSGTDSTREGESINLGKWVAVLFIS